MERVLEPTWHEAGGVAFELECFAPAGRGRLELTGRWFGIRGRRFVRPMLTLRADGERCRLLADLEHKPWAAGDGEPWRASFPWEHESEEVSDVELTVGPDIAVELPAPGGHAGRGQRPRGQSRRRSSDAQALALRRELQELRRQLVRQEEAAAALLGEERDRRARVQSELDALAAELTEVQTKLEQLAAERDNARTNLELIEAERDQAVDAARRAGAEHQQLTEALREAHAELKAARSQARAGQFEPGVAPARSEAGVGRRSEAGAAPAHSEAAPARPELGAQSEAGSAARSEPATAPSSSPVSVPPPAVPSGPPPQPSPPPSHPPLLTPAARSRRWGRYSSRREADWVKRLLAIVLLVAVLIAFAIVVHIR